MGNKRLEFYNLVGRQYSVVVVFVVANCTCTVCRRDEDIEHVTLPDSDSELESGQFAEFEQVMPACHLHRVCVEYDLFGL